MTYRKGDKVSVAGTITHDQREDKEVFVRLDGYYTDIMLPAGGGDYCTRTLSSIRRIKQEPQT